MFRAPVPETAVHEHRHALLGKQKIRPHPATSDFGFWTSDFHLPSPAGNPGFPEQTCHTQRPSVSFDFCLCSVIDSARCRVTRV